MKFGVALQVGNVRPHDWSSVEAAKAAEDMGFDSLWTSHRPTVRGEDEDTLAPLIWIASLIHVVPEMQLGVNVVVLPLLDAVVLANQAATLSRFSGQRFVLGVGVGWNEVEYQRLGADFGSRGRRADESIEVMRRLWREEQVNFSGEFYNLTDMAIYPRPESGHPPLWIGGSSTAAIDRAARVGDGWSPALMDPQALSEGVARLQRGLSARPMPTVATAEYVHPMRPVAEAKAEQVNIAGTTNEMIATLDEYQEAGLDHLVCVFATDDMDEQLRQMRIFSEKVMPHFVE